jgi:hypothetical protein
MPDARPPSPARLSLWTLLITIILAGGGGPVGQDPRGPGGPDAGGPDATGSPTAGAPPADWTSAVGREIRESEYRFSAREDGAWSAPNRAHDLRTRIAPAGIEVTSRTRGADADDGGWLLALSLAGYGREGSLAAVEPAVLDVSDNRAELRRGGLSEWYVNDETVAIAPEKA